MSEAVARGMRGNWPLFVGEEPGGGDEVGHPHGGRVLAMDVRDRGAHAHGKERPRHWPGKGRAVAQGTSLEPK